MKIKDLWEKFKKLKWYWKILLILPLLILFVCLFIFVPSRDINKSLVKQTKKNTDNFIKKIEEENVQQDKKIKQLKKQEEKIIEQKIKVNSKINRIKAKHNDQLNKIKKTQHTVSQLTNMHNNLRESANKLKRSR